MYKDRSTVSRMSNNRCLFQSKQKRMMRMTLLEQEKGALPHHPQILYMNKSVINTNLIILTSIYWPCIYLTIDTDNILSLEHMSKK